MKFATLKVFSGKFGRFAVFTVIVVEKFRSKHRKCVPTSVFLPFPACAVTVKMCLLGSIPNPLESERSDGQ